MEYKNKEEILKQIVKFHRLYKNKLVNKEFLIIYKTLENIKKANISFLKENFFHLIGIEQGKSFLTPLNFYKKLERKQLKITDFEVRNFTLKKLSVSSEMIRIFSEKSKIAVYDTENKYQKNLSIDNGMALSIPKSNAVLGIRYIKEDETVPVSLLQQKLENISQKDTITDIICMFEKNIKEKQYNKVVYNTVDIQEILKIDKELEKILTFELLKEIYPEKENEKAEEKIDNNEKDIDYSSISQESLNGENEVDILNKKNNISQSSDEKQNSEENKKVTTEKNNGNLKEKTKTKKERPKREKRSRSRGNER